MGNSVQQTSLGVQASASCGPFGGAAIGAALNFDACGGISGDTSWEYRTPGLSP
jgi:hypothetical protein